MTVMELTRRLEALEEAVSELRREVRGSAEQGRKWWRAGGRFANDPVFEEIVRFGREYRESLRPARGRPRTA